MEAKVTAILKRKHGRTVQVEFERETAIVHADQIIEELPASARKA